MINFQLKPICGLLMILEARQREAEVMLSIPLASTIPTPSLASGKISAIKAPPQPAQQKIPDSTNIYMRGLLNTAESVITPIELRGSLDRIEIFRGKLARHLEAHEYLAEIRTLTETINKELEKRWFYYYPQEKIEVLLRIAPDWAKSYNAFKNTAKDAVAATDCYALGYNTASVFHSMRVAEYGLRALAKERRITLSKKKPIEWATWQDLLTKLKDEETRIGKGAQAGAAKDRALAFYSGAHSDLTAFKDEYRNLVMHVRSNYDDLQALRALTRVREFMDRISERLSDKHYRVRWGLKF